MIDWTQPCETDETPPFGARVLADDCGGLFPVAVLVGQRVFQYSRKGGPGPDAPTLRNVPAKPVRHEAWVNLYASGVSGSHSTRKAADELSSKGWHPFVECRHIVWNSDGSPVEDKTIIRLTAAEIQSGYDRVWFAEGLIRQLPKTHEGRNTWLLNYGSLSDGSPVEEACEDCEQLMAERDNAVADRDHWKAKPVRQEGWVAIYRDAGQLSVAKEIFRDQVSSREARPSAEAHCHIVWNEDGSPVEDSTVIRLTAAEAQSGLDRVRSAEGLIRQLPGTHDGRNTWLLNYGSLSDGSPVSGADAGPEYWMNRFTEMTADRDHWKAKAELAERQGVEFALRCQDDVNLWKAKAEGLEAEVAQEKRNVLTLVKTVARQEEAARSHAQWLDRMRPVVDVAVALSEAQFSANTRHFESLHAAVRAYQNTMPATSESHEAMVDDALDGFHEALPPMKDCATCRFHCKMSIWLCIERGYLEWEAKP